MMGAGFLRKMTRASNQRALTHGKDCGPIIPPFTATLLSHGSGVFPQFRLCCGQLCDSLGDHRTEHWE